MTWVPDSTTAGYLGPEPAPAPSPLEGDAWENFLHDWIAGVSGYDPTLVRPRWQQVPPDMPAVGTDWMAFGIQNTTPDWDPYIGHVDDGAEGYDVLQEHEIVDVLCSFYGPNCEMMASITRRGMFIDQNRAVLRANGVGLVEVGAFTHAPELFRQQWLPRVDATVILKREVLYNYAVRTIVRAKGQIIANPPGGERTVETDFDTGAGSLS